jgi:exonuclease VII large subunit
MDKDFRNKVLQFIEDAKWHMERTEERLKEMEKTFDDEIKATDEWAEGIQNNLHSMLDEQKSTLNEQEARLDKLENQE